MYFKVRDLNIEKSSFKKNIANIISHVIVINLN